MKPTILPLITLAVFTACSSQPDLDVGDETKVTGQALSDYAAAWDGYIEAFKVTGDGSDRVRIVLDESGEGTVRFGDQALHGPATEPAEYYPSTPWVHENFQAGVESGFEYLVVSAQVSSSRLQFEFDLTIQESWCALQNPEPIPGWTCNTGSGGQESYDPDTGNAIDCKVYVGTDLVPIDCETLSMCRSCDCDEQACHAKPRARLAFDGALSNEGNSLEGTLVLFDGSRVTTRLTR